jgi:hypothetical protein
VAHTNEDEDTWGDFMRRKLAAMFAMMLLSLSFNAQSSQVYTIQSKAAQLLNLSEQIFAEIPDGHQLQARAGVFATAAHLFERKTHNPALTTEDLCREFITGPHRHFYLLLYYIDQHETNMGLTGLLTEAAIILDRIDEMVHQ